MPFPPDPAVAGKLLAQPLVLAALHERPVHEQPWLPLRCQGVHPEGNLLQAVRALFHGPGGDLVGEPRGKPSVGGLGQQDAGQRLVRRGRLRRLAESAHGSQPLHVVLPLHQLHEVVRYVAMVEGTGLAVEPSVQPFADLVTEDVRAASRQLFGDPPASRARCPLDERAEGTTPKFAVRTDPVQQRGGVGTQFRLVGEPFQAGHSRSAGTGGRVEEVRVGRHGPRGRYIDRYEPPHSIAEITLHAGFRAGDAPEPGPHQAEYLRPSVQPGDLQRGQPAVRVRFGEVDGVRGCGTGRRGAQQHGPEAQPAGGGVGGHLGPGQVHQPFERPEAAFLVAQEVSEPRLSDGLFVDEEAVGPVRAAPPPVLSHVDE